MSKLSLTGNSRKRDKLAVDDPKALIKALAMNVGKNIVSYLDYMFPEAAKACSGSFRLSVRNSICNEIMAAIELDSEGNIIDTLKRHDKHRRTMRRLNKLSDTAQDRPFEQVIAELKKLRREG